MLPRRGLIYLLRQETSSRDDYIFRAAMIRSTQSRVRIGMESQLEPNVDDHWGY